MPAVPYRNPNNYVKYSARLATALNETESAGAVWANQFDNVANRQAHVETTGPEIWAQTEGTVDAFVAATGTGGTLAGVSRYLKEHGDSVDLLPELYVGRAPTSSALDAQIFVDRILEERERTVAALAEIYGGPLETRRINMERTLELRRPALRRLHETQVARMREWRADGSDDPEQLRRLLLIVNAIASGLIAGPRMRAGSPEITVTAGLGDERPAAWIAPM